MFVIKNSEVFYSKTVVSKGHGFKTPQMCSVCNFRVSTGSRGMLVVSEEHTKVMAIGDADTPIEQVIEDCLRTMKEGEKCVLNFNLPKGNIGKITEVHNTYEFSPAEFIELNFQLVSFTHKEMYEIDAASKLEYATYHKQRGIDLYSSEEFQPAFRHFGLTLKFIISYEYDDKLSDPEEQETVKELKLSAYLNLAACQMKRYNYDSVAKNSTKALKISPSNLKALYRRGFAYARLQEYEKAEADLRAAQKLAPHNMTVAREILELKERVKKHDEIYAKGLKKMFS